MDDTFETRKATSRAIAIRNIEPATKSKYTDLKAVYTHESVLGVSEMDYINTHSVEDRKTERARTIAPLSTEEASKLLAQEHEKESIQASERMFNLLQMDRVHEKHQQTFWGKLMTLTQ
jgi:hypothetical protein